MKKQHVQFVGLVVAYATMSVSVVGCMNFLKAAPGHTNRSGRLPEKELGSHHAGTPGASPGGTAGATIAGEWKCADTRCDVDSVKVISLKEDSIETTNTIHDPKTASVCRVDEVAELSARNDENHDTYEAAITPTSVKVIASDDNTANCADVYKEPSAKTSVPIIASVDHGVQKIKIDGIQYTRAQAADLKRIAAAHVKTAAPKYNPWGSTWVCVDAGHTQDQLRFSADQKTIAYDFNQTFGSDTCLVEMSMPVSGVAAGPLGALNKMTVTITKQGLVPAGNSNPASCDSELETYNEQPIGANKIPEVVTFDGLNSLMIKGHRYLR